MRLQAPFVPRFDRLFTTETTVVNRSLLARQLDQRDFAADAEARRRTPVASAATDIQQRVAEAMQSGHDRLKPADQQIEWKELTAVGVSGELQVDAQLRSGLDRLRPVSEQNRERVVWCAF